MLQNSTKEKRTRRLHIPGKLWILFEMISGETGVVALSTDKIDRY